MPKQICTGQKPDDPVPAHQLARQRAGEHLDTVDLKAGDILYLPTGRYHEALVHEDHSIHLSFALKLLRPKDVMASLFAQLADQAWVDEALYINRFHPKNLSFPIQFVIVVLIICSSH